MRTKQRNIMRVALFLAAIFFLSLLLVSGCGREETESVEQVLLEGEGIYIGQVDSSSVEIEFEGTPTVFALGTGVSVANISDGAQVFFTYVEEEERPVLLIIEAAAADEEEVADDDILQAEGIYNGRIDNTSVEIETNQGPRAFEIGENVDADSLIDGSRIAYTYSEGESRPLLIEVEVLEEAARPADNELVGEGVYVGQIDSRSIEIEMNRVFVLGETASVDNIEDGSDVAFTFRETGQRAVIDSIYVIDGAPEGEIMQGTYIGQVDSQSIEIFYAQSFTIGEGVDIDQVPGGADVVYTYLEDADRPYRPVLTSIAVR